MNILVLGQKQHYEETTSFLFRHLLICVSGNEILKFDVVDNNRERE